MKRNLLPAPLGAFLALALSMTARGQDMPLTQILAEGEGWEVAAEGYGLADGLCADAEGNLYFSDVKDGTAIYRMDLEGRVTEFIAGAAGISGLQWGSDGRLHACAARGRRVLAFTPEGAMETRAEEVRPNDLVVAADGNLYFTMTPSSEIRRVDPAGVMTVVSAGEVGRPNGISLSPDQGTLAVSDHGGKHVWAFRVKADGALDAGAPWMELRTPAEDPEVSRGDGMATDIHGRWYVASAEGVQVFDPTGRMCGVILKPQDAALVSVAFAGEDHAWLHAACGDKIYRRMTKTQGALFFQPPRAAEPPPKE